ncbi:hypothetical protein D3C72_2226290 [compost metagenome]
MHWRLLARTPDKTDQREAVERVAVQQVLLVVAGMGLCHLRRQPVVVRDQRLHRCRGRGQQRGFVVTLRGRLFDQPADGGDECTQPFDVMAHDASRDVAWTMSGS